MSKLVFAMLVLLAGLAVHAALRRRAEVLPTGLRTIGLQIALGAAIGVPPTVLLFSVLRIIPAGDVGVKAQQYLTRWDGRLPQYTFGGNAVPSVHVPGGGAADGDRR